MLENLLPRANPQDSPSIGIHRTARSRHEGGRKFSHFDGTWSELVGRVLARLVPNFCKAGTQSGSIVVHLEPEGFFSMIGSQKDDKAGWVKPPAKNTAEIVLYSREALVACGEAPSTNALFEIVSIHAW